MSVPRTLYVVVGAISAPVGLSIGAMAPVAGLLAGMIAAALVMLLTTAGVLLAADWRADQQSRQAWAEVAPALAEWKPIVCKEVGDRETRYRSGVAEDALRNVFRARRFVPSRLAAEVEPPVAHSASQPAPTRSFPTGTACQTGQQGGRVDSENNAGALVRDEPIDQANLGASRARPAKCLALGAGRQRAGRYSAVDDTWIRLAVNAGPNWLASDWALATPRHAAEVVVLSSSRDTQHMQSAEAAAETACATRTEPPNGRGPPSLEQRRLARGVATKAGGARSASSGGDLVVVDNLGQPVPVCAAEVDVIETYLGDVVDELFASRKAGSEPERA